MLDSQALSSVVESQPLALHHWPCQQARSLEQPLVLVHGWGSDSRTWCELAPLLTLHFDLIAIDLPGFGDSPSIDVGPDQLLELLSDQLPDKMVMVGWSLGGMIATAFTRRFPDRVTHLLTLASNASFVQRPQWPLAMAAPRLQQFSDLFRRDPATCLQRFTGLQAQGEPGHRQLQKSLRRLQPAIDRAAWQKALTLLAEIDNRASITGLLTPALFLFGEHDALVPVAAAEQVRQLLGSRSDGRVEVLPGVAHAPHLSRPHLVAERIELFLRQDPYLLEKSEVAAAFGKAAATYDSAARLQRQTGERLLQRLDEYRLQPRRFVDLGCGTGLCARLLQQRYPRATCIGLDLAEGMLRHCQARSSASGAASAKHSECIWMCGDAEQLPFADCSLDLVFSNFTFQWCQQPDVLFAEIDRVLRPGGVLAFSTIGPGSLRELRSAWRAVDGYTHVNRFSPLAQVRQHLLDRDFRIEIFAETEEVLYYPELGDLTRELKAIGAHNVNAGRNVRITGRQRIARLRRAYEQFRTPLGLPASWQILQVVAVRK